jgi:AraC-like DNA-binding protein
MKNWVWHGYQTIAYNYDYYILIENTISIIYLVISLKIIYAHQRRIKLHFSQTNFRSLEWLKKLCFGGISLILLDTGTTVYEEAFGNLSWNVGYVTIVSLCLFLFYFSFYTLKQRKVIVPSFLFEIEEAIQNTPTLTAERIYLKKLKNEEIHNSKERLLNIMSKQKFFLKPDLILPDIAKELKLTDKQPTELLKLELNTNFYDFVNQYRVEEVKTKINSGKFENFTLLAIGTESGFQSKSSFNRVFKKITGMSPSEYKKSNH